MKQSARRVQVNVTFESFLSLRLPANIYHGFIRMHSESYKYISTPQSREYEINLFATQDRINFFLDRIFQHSLVRRINLPEYIKLKRILENCRNTRFIFADKPYIPRMNPLICFSQCDDAFEEEQSKLREYFPQS